MAKPSLEVDDKEYYKDIFFLYEIINRMKNQQEIRLFLKDMLTPSELRMFKRRWHIACALEANLPIREAAQLTKTSTATVLKVAERLHEGRGGLRIALERTRGERSKSRKLKEGVSATYGHYYYMKK